jgi:betaine reductase
MDLENQKRVKAAADTHGAENVIVIIGAAEAEAAGLAAETVTNGDPTFAGPLTGVQLGLRVYHCVEQEFKDQVDAAVYGDQIGMMEMVLPMDEIVEEMRSMRDQFCKYKD